MGRGLSELQVKLLQMSLDEKALYQVHKNDPEIMKQAAEAKAKNSHHDLERISYEFHIPECEEGWVYFDEALVKLWGFKPITDKYGLIEKYRCSWRSSRRLKFSKNLIGIKQYYKAKVALQKSIERLEKRGLIIVNWSLDYHCFKITEEGEKVMIAKTEKLAR